jgi:hypothetical protein
MRWMSTIVFVNAASSHSRSVTGHFRHAEKPE